MSISESLFHSLRGAISIAWADHQLTDAEQDSLRYFIDTHDLSERQRELLDADIANGAPSIESLLPHITEPRDRAHLVNMARVILHADGHAAPQEAAPLQHLLHQHMSTLDSEVIRQQARDQMTGYRHQQDEADNARPWYEKLSDYLEWLWP